MPPAMIAFAFSVTRARHVVILAVCVSAAYYLGGILGLTLKLPDATPSVIWPPNAILTSALLLTPARLWPLILLSALPAHLLLESDLGWPMTLVLSLFATNCSEALIAAGGMRWLSDAPLDFSTLRRVDIFLGVAVVAAPLLSTFLDAGAVTLFLDQPYWMVWRARLFSNILTELTVVPSVVTLVISGSAWLRSAERKRKVEALLLAGSLLLVTAILLGTVRINPMAATLADRAPLAVLLPFLLWAALRFGPGGASLALLTSALVLAGASVHSRGPFEGLSPGDTTLALQLSLIVVSLTIFGVAALVEERRVAQQDLSNRLAFEKLIARLSTAFVHLPSDRMREAFDEWLQRIGEFLEFDCLILNEYSGEGSDLTRISAWAAGGTGNIPDTSARRDFPWGLERALRREIVIVEDAARLPPDAAIDRRSFARYGFRSGLAIPLLAGDTVLGILVAGAIATRTPASLRVEHLQVIAAVLANALARKTTEDLLRTSETMKSAILTSLTSGVVVLDRNGRIIAINEEWRRIVGDHAPATATEVGGNYLEYCRDVARRGNVWAADAVAGIESVLSRTRDAFALEYIASRDPEERWFSLRAVPLDRPEGGAVVTHRDVTERRRADLDAQRIRGELAHVSRVSTIGVLTASLAHQLNQPLAAILANAQAAQRFLQSPTPDLAEVRASLEDIVDDDRRASEVIVRLRELLRKGDGSDTEIDFTQLVRDVVQLIRSDAIIRNVEIDLQLGHEPAIVRGDRVQLQQVVLNVAVNALEAVADQPPGQRRVIVHCRAAAEECVELSVIDSGPGFDAESKDKVFEAFYTTKRGGMGMGLSIARLIVEAHGGIIRAANSPAGGAWVSCRVPLAGAVASHQAMSF